jgi:quercetin dioxygenase-like cupin family protein
MKLNGQTPMSQDQVPFDENAVGSSFVDPGKLPWQVSDAPGFDTITLFENRLTGESTVLMKVAPGAFADIHSHELLEEIYVLEGEFADQTRRYAKGQYCIRAAGAPHTATSESGCVILLVYRLPKNR